MLNLKVNILKIINNKKLILNIYATLLTYKQFFNIYLKYFYIFFTLNFLILIKFNIKA